MKPNKKSSPRKISKVKVPSSTGITSSDKPRSSIPTDPRPIKDLEFLKDAKLNLFKFLELTGYPRSINSVQYTKISNSDVKSIFEHMIMIMVPQFRLNESSMNPEERILNFFATFQYKNNFHKTHITSPSILSSVPYVTGAFDYLRRLAITHLNNNPSMMFPKSICCGISYEKILDELIAFQKRMENGQFQVQALLEFETAIRNEVGMTENDEINQLSNKNESMEKLLKSIDQIHMEIIGLESQFDQIYRSMQTKVALLDTAKKSNEELDFEYSNAMTSLDFLLREKEMLEVKKNKCEELGYADNAKHIQDCKINLEKIRAQNRQLKIESEEYKQGFRKLNIEMSDVRFNTLNAFRDAFELFRYLIEEDMRVIVTDLKSEYLIDYDGKLRPYISRLNTAIELESQKNQESLNELDRYCQHFNNEYQTEEKDVEFLEVEMKLLENSYRLSTQNQSSAQEQATERKSIIQDILRQTQEEFDVVGNVDTEKEMGKNEFEELKLSAEEACRFYHVDIDFQQKCWENQLQTLQECWELRESLFTEQQSLMDNAKAIATENQNELEAYRLKLEEFLENVDRPV